MNVFDLVATITLNSDGYKAGLQDAQKSTEQTSNAIGIKTVAIGNIIANLATKAGDFFSQVAEVGIKYNAQIETYAAALTTALGNEAAAAAAIEQIKEDAARTPYSVDGLVKANSYLIAAGESAEEARATILALTDAVSATGGGNAELQRMAQNLQQIKNVGKATSMDIRQFAMAGIDVYGILADYMGKTTAEVQDLDVSYEMLSGALQNAAAEGGRFYQANIRQSQTLNGQISTLKDNVSAGLGEAFSGVTSILSGKLLPAANAFITGLDVDKVVAGFEKLAKAAGVVVAMIGAEKARSAFNGWLVAIKPLIASYMELTKEMMLADIEQAALNGQLTLGQVAVGVLTGDITLATAAQVAWNAAVAAFPAAIIVAGLAAIGFSVYDAVQGQQEYIDSLVNTGETVGEVAANLDDMKAKYAELEEAAKNGATEASLYTEMDALSVAIANTTERLDMLTLQEKLQAAAAEAAAQSTATYVETVDGQMIPVSEEAAAATEAFKNSLGGVVSEYTKTYDNISKKVQGWFGLFDTAKTNVKTSVSEMIAAMQSQIDFNTNYSANLNQIAQYGLPEVGKAFQQMGADGAAYAAALVAAVEGAGGATSEGGQKIINSFKEMSQGVSNSQADLTEALTNVTGEFDSAFGKILDSEEAAVAAMNMADDAAASGAATIKAYINAITAGVGPAGAAAAKVAKAAAAGLAGGGKGASGRGAVSVPLLASGSDYIPFDNYPAVLHKGEMVVPAKISEDLRDFVAGGGKTTAPTGNSEIVVLLRELIEATRRPIFLDSGALVGHIASAMDDALGAVGDLRGRGLSLA